MKKILSVFLILTILMFCGCTRLGENNLIKVPLESVSIPTQFNALVTITQGEFTGEAQVGYIKDLELIATITQPEKLKGMKISVKQDSCEISYKGLTYKADTQKFINTSFAKVMVEVLLNAETSTNVTKSEKDLVKIVGTVSAGEYTIIKNTSTDQIMSIEVPNMDLLINFTY